MNGNFEQVERFVGMEGEMKEICAVSKSGIGIGMF